ncbi:MAG: hypothetical protein ABIG28_00895 [archaeon]
MRKIDVLFLVLFFVSFGLVCVVAEEESALSPSAGTDVSVAVDGSAPIVNIISPENGKVYSNMTLVFVDYSIDDISFDSAWYSLGNGINKSTSGPFYLELDEGNYLLRIYANDSFNRINFSEVSFNVSGSVPYCGDLDCNNGEDCSNCETDCGVCATPPGPSSDGGSSGSSRKQEAKFELDRRQIKVSLKQGEIKREFLEIKNTDSKKIKFEISSSFDNDIVHFSEEEFELGRGEMKSIAIDFVALKEKIPDIYLGEIVVSSEDTERKILTSVEVESKQALFDVKLEILGESLKIFPGEKILAIVTIFSLGREGRVDTNVKYLVKDENGRVIFENEEVVAVDVQTSFVREFKIPEDAEIGNYVLYVPVKYNGNSGSASQLFEVSGNEEIRKEMNLEGLIILLLVILVVYLLWRLERKKVKRRRNRN